MDRRFRGRLMSLPAPPTWGATLTEILVPPPVTRAELDVTRRWEDRSARRRGADLPSDLDRDILLCLDIIALLRAHISVSGARLGLLTRLLEERAAADAARAIRDVNDA